jgi:hypothetical protein
MEFGWFGCFFDGLDGFVDGFWMRVDGLDEFGLPMDDL